MTQSHRRDWWILFPGVAAALLFAAGNTNFGFDSEGWLDPFVYVGYFWHYPEHLTVFDGNYKISRLPWILPGYVAHTIGGPIAGSYALGYVSLTMGAVALYLLVRDALGDRVAAAVASIAFACCTQVHGVGGWAYHMLAAAGFYLMACWLVLRAATGPAPKRAALMSGAFFAAAVHTHLFLVVFAPLLAWLHMAAVGPPPAAAWRRSLRDAALLVGGGVALTAVLGGINAATGGDWLFFLPQLEHALSLSASGADRWWLGDSGVWLPGAYYLVLPSVFLVAGLPVLLGIGGEPRGRLARVLVAQAWVAMALMAYFQFWRRQTTLDYAYMAFPLYLHAFPCLAAALSHRNEAPRVRARWAVVAAMMVMLSTLALLPAAGTWIASTSARLGLSVLPPAAAPLVAGVACAIAVWLLPAPARVLGFAAWFAVLNVWIAPNASPYGWGTQGTRQQMLTLFYEADHFTADLDPTLEGIKYWISIERVSTPHGEMDLAAVFNSFVATRTWLTNLLARTSPGIPIEQLSGTVFERGPCIGLLSSVEGQAELRHAIRARFARVGLMLEEVDARRFESRDLSFALTVLRTPDASKGLARRRGLIPPCTP